MSKRYVNELGNSHHVALLLDRCTAALLVAVIVHTI